MQFNRFSQHISLLFSISHTLSHINCLLFFYFVFVSFSFSCLQQTFFNLHFLSYFIRTSDALFFVVIAIPVKRPTTTLVCQFQVRHAKPPYRIVKSFQWPTPTAHWQTDFITSYHCYLPGNACRTLST